MRLGEKMNYSSRHRRGHGNRGKIENNLYRDLHDFE